MQRLKQQTSAWLDSAAFDLTLIFAVLGLACALAGATVLSPALFLPLLTLHIWVLSYDHVFSTFTKLAGLAEDRRRNRFLIYPLPPLVFCAVLAVGSWRGTGALYTVYFFWQFFHTVRQSWGLAQQYRHKAGGLPWDDVRLAEVTLWAIPLWGFLHRCQQQQTDFLWQQIYLPKVPLWIVSAMGIISGALFAIWIAMRVRAFRRGELSLPHTLFLLSHFFVFIASYVLVSDINSGWLLVNVWHNAQYLLFVYLHNRQRFARGVDRQAALLSWLCQPGFRRGASYFLALIGSSALFYFCMLRAGYGLDDFIQARAGRLASLASLALTFWLTLNFHHYLVDAVIWKRRPSRVGALP